MCIRDSLYVSDVFENLEDYDRLQPHEEQGQLPPLPPAISSTVEVLPGETLARASERHDQGHHEDFPARAASDQEQASPEVPHGASEAQHFEEQPGVDQLTPREDHLAQAEERQPDSNASAPQKFSAPYNPTQNYSNRSGHDRQGQNYGRGGDRGRGGRWGRRGGRNRGGRPQGGPGGRNLPPSKYAPPQSGEFRGYDSRGGQQRGGYDNRRQEGPRPSASAPDITEEILLPGESLAKYRGKPVAAQSPVPIAEQVSPDDSAPSAPSGGVSVPRRFSGGLPSWLLADAATEAEAPSATGANETEAPEAPAAHEAEPVRSDADLNEDQVAALAADLVEAKHEEATAEAEADALVGGAVFEEEEEDSEEETEAAAEPHAEEVSSLTEEETAEVEAGRAADRADFAADVAQETAEHAAALGGPHEDQSDHGEHEEESEHDEPGPEEQLEAEHVVSEAEVIAASPGEPVAGAAIIELSLIHI